MRRLIQTESSSSHPNNRRGFVPVAVALVATLQLACASRPQVEATPQAAAAHVAVDPVVHSIETPATGLYWGNLGDVACECERDAIFDLVRAHRRTASERWRNRLTDAIFSESRAADVDPLIVASIVAKESSFKSQIVSHAGAVGLMQLRPFVAKDLAHRVDVSWGGRRTLNSPELNVRLGIVYYKELLERFDGDLEKALTAYNYGPTRVSKQVRQGTYARSGYARDIMALYGRLDGERLTVAHEDRADDAV